MDDKQNGVEVCKWYTLSKIKWSDDIFHLQIRKHGSYSYWNQLKIVWNFLWKEYYWFIFLSFIPPSNAKPITVSVDEVEQLLKGLQTQKTLELPPIYTSQLFIYSPIFWSRFESECLPSFSDRRDMLASKLYHTASNDEHVLNSIVL